MKATGIIRRIDDLGRVVIPKELRRAMRIREKDPLEIFTGDDSIILKKYTPDDFSFFAIGIAKTLFKQLKHPVLICNLDTVLEVVGREDLSRELNGRRVSETLYENNMKILGGQAESGSFSPVEARKDIVCFRSAPIVNDARDIFGSISLLGEEDSQLCPEDQIRFQMSVNFIGDQFDEV